LTNVEYNGNIFLKQKLGVIIMEELGALLGGGITLIISLAYLGIALFLMVLYIKLALRGIKALDIYINKNQQPPQQDFSQPNYPPQNFPDNQ